MLLMLKHVGGQSCDHKEPRQERLMVKTLKRVGRRHS